MEAPGEAVNKRRPQRTLGADVKFIPDQDLDKRLLTVIRSSSCVRFPGLRQRHQFMDDLRPTSQWSCKISPTGFSFFLW